MQHQQLIFRPGGGARLRDLPTDADGGFGSDEEAKASLRRDVERCAASQDLLMAHRTYGLLILFQGMDAAGKDEAIRHVMAGLDPQGCEVKLFKEPAEKEIRHDYLWRAFLALPARGQIGIFNRSYYESVVAERVHPERLEKQHLPDEAKEDIWERRFRHINGFETYLIDNGIHVLKFFFHVSREVQRKRLLERIDRREQQWQFSPDDVREREHWDAYEAAYDDALRHTSTEGAPWYVVPADGPWSARAAVASVVAAKLGSFHTDYPALGEEQREEMDRARERLEREGR